MKIYQTIKTGIKNFALGAFALAASPFAMSAVTSAFDGNWYDPATNGQGFIFETNTREDGSVELVVVFNTYDINGRPTFYTAAGDITGDVIKMPLYRPTVTALGPGQFSVPEFVPVGQLELLLESCIGGNVKVTFFNASGAGTDALVVDKGFSKIRVGSGSFSVRRLRPTAQLKRCTGGLIDNVLPAAAPVGFDRTIDKSTYSVRTRYVRRPDAVEFVLEFFDLPVGSYNLAVQDVLVTSFQADASGSGTRGEVRFRSPEIPFARDLDFDPLNQEYEVINANGVLPFREKFKVDFVPEVIDTNIGFTQGTTPANVTLSSPEAFSLNQIAGAATGASANFKLSTVFNRAIGFQEFRVRVDGAQPGTYQVLVNGDRRGEFQVIGLPRGRTGGEISFRSPVSLGSALLDFDPRGATVELIRGGVTEYRARRSQ